MIKVAVAIIVNDQKKILVTQRPLYAPHGGFWEFPGGKLESNELPENALIREVKEEVGIDILSYNFLGEINHQYETKTVRLYVFLVEQFSGKPTLLEEQIAMKWLSYQKLDPKNFPAANQQVIQLIPDFVISNDVE